jgi:hypothetical protein
MANMVEILLTKHKALWLKRKHKISLNIRSQLLDGLDLFFFSPWTPSRIYGLYSYGRLCLKLEDCQAVEFSSDPEII